MLQDFSAGGLPAGWSDSASPANVPGGENLDPDFSVSFASEEGNGNGEGILPSTSETIIFDLDGVSSLSDIIEGLSNGTLRIGLHLTGIGPNNEFSASYITTTVVPVPAAAGLGFLGMGLVGLVRRRKAKRG